MKILSQVLEPACCAVVRRHIEDRDLIAAANVLAETQDEPHREINQLKREVAQQLIDKVQQQLTESAVRRYLIDDIEESLGTCRKLGEHRLETARVQEQFERWKHNGELLKASHQRRQIEAKQKAAAGRMMTAIHGLPSADECDDQAFENELLKSEWQHDVGQLDRWLDQAEQLLRNGHVEAARERCQQAVDVNRLDARVVDLQARIAATQKSTRQSQIPQSKPEISSGDCIMSFPRPLKLNDTTVPRQELMREPEISSSESAILELAREEMELPLVLSLNARRLAMVVGQRMTIGGCRDASDPVRPGTVQLMSRLNRNEVEFRNSDESFILSVGTSASGCSLNDRKLSRSEKTVINDGDILALDSGRQRFAVRRTRPGLLILESLTESGIRERSGRVVQGIILSEAMLTFGGKSAHLQIAGLPSMVTVHFVRQGLQVVAADHVVWWDRPPAGAANDRFLANLRIEPVPSGAAGLLDMFSGYDVQGQTIRFDRG